MEEQKLLEYEKPKIVTYTDEKILEMLGPAHANNSNSVSHDSVGFNR